MINSFRSFLSLPAIIGTVLLLMGADSHVKSSVTSSVTSSMTNSVTDARVKNTVTTSVTSSMTTSVTGAKLKSSVTASAAVSVISRVTATPVTLSAYAEELAKILKFDRHVLIMVREETQEHIQRLIGFDEEGYQIIAPGIAVSVPEDKTDRILASLRHKLVPLHYMPFVVEMNDGIRTDKIGIIKGTDPYEILRIMHTDGDEFDITNEDVIDRLKEWEKISSFDIVGADSDWVELEFKTLPKDVKAFAEEVYEFCPDAVEQGPGTVDGLSKEIMRTGRLFLWWD